MHNSMKGKSLFKLDVILKNNNLANTETETRRDWTWFQRAHNIKDRGPPPKPSGSQIDEILSNLRLKQTKQNKKTPTELSLLAVSLFFPLFLEPTTIYLSFPPINKMAHGKTASDLHVAKVNDQNQPSSSHPIRRMR